MNSHLGTPSLKSLRLERELSAGLVVSLVALPLCLGVALASGAPLAAGVVAGIIGGMVVTPLSGSPLSVSGPAAGLAVIVADGIKSCGSYSVFCSAVVLAGIMQIVFGLLHLGKISDIFPNSVIRGMLAGIGAVIVLKQIPHALGQDVDYEGDLAFYNIISGNNTASAIYQAIEAHSLLASSIALVSLAIIIFWDKFAIHRIPPLRFLPSALLAVVVGTLIHEVASGISPGLALDPSHMVQLPVVGSISRLGGLISFPSLSGLDDLRRVLPLGLTLAIVASLETLLSVEAVDKLDPLRRISSTNRELVAQGIGNLVSGCVGGLPITAVIVRSSANVYAGARTRVSGFFHGILLLFAITIAPSLLNRIPLACLAAVLIVVGVKLASPILIRTMWREGREQFLPFAGTALAVMFSDLLTGVLIGLCLGLFFVIRRHRTRSICLILSDGGSLIRFNKDLSFIHRAELKDILINLPEKTSVLIDATGAFYVDNDIRELLRDFADLAPLRHITLEFRGIKFS